MVNDLYRIGPIATDKSSYYEVQVSTDDRQITPARLDAPRAVIAHPDDWPADTIEQSKALLPTLDAQYEQTQRDKRTVVIRYAGTGAGSLVGSVTALDDDTTIFLEARSPWNEGGTFDAGDRGIVATSPALDDPGAVGHFELSPTTAPDAEGAYASVNDMVAAMSGKAAKAGHAAAALRYTLDKGETVTFGAAVADQPLAPDPPSRGQVLGALEHARAEVDDGNLTGSGSVARAATPLRTAISLNSNYDEKTRRHFVMWGWGGGGDDIFTVWDSGWDAITAASVDPALAVDDEYDLFDVGGPRYNQENAGAMHAYTTWRLYTDFGDRALLAKAYPTSGAPTARPSTSRRQVRPGSRCSRAPAARRDRRRWARAART
jgi:hypothetical protein